MKTCRYILAVLLAQSAVAAFPHPGGHSEPPPPVANCKIVDNCTQDEVRRGGLNVIAKLIDRKKLDNSWADIKTASNTKKEQGYWVVTYKNPKEQDVLKQTFHVFISLDGVLERASFTDQ
jgi:hypothetical protein